MASRLGAVLSAAAAIMAVLVLAVPGGLAAAEPAEAGSSLRSGALPTYANVSYRSSVDGYLLSFLEWLPTGYSANSTYPLGVFLHGIGTSTAWQRGGVGSLVDLEGGATGIVTAAQADGVILISINTRSSAGFYQDTLKGGPQRQDVLDAIAYEESRRHVGSVYLIGFSMGSMGAFALAESDRDAFAGVATVGTITDAYEVLAQNAAAGSVSAAWRYDVGLPRTAPLTSAALQPLLWNLSQVRFDPQGLAGVRIYSVAGEADIRATNNFSVWPYAQGNSTFTNSTCNVAAADAEPANCTTTLGSLAANSSAYIFRFVWEPYGTHAAADLPASDAWRFLLGQEGGGYFEASVPPTKVWAINP